MSVWSVLVRVKQKLIWSISKHWYGRNKRLLLVVMILFAFVVGHSYSMPAFNDTGYFPRADTIPLTENLDSLRVKLSEIVGLQPDNIVPPEVPTTTTTTSYVRVSSVKSETGVKRQFHFHRNRVRLWNTGRCIDAPDGIKLAVAFCDPEVEQSFTLTVDSKLIYDRTGQCVSYEYDSDSESDSESESDSDSDEVRTSLSLLNCDEEPEIGRKWFHLVNDSYLCTNQTFGSAGQLCLTPITRVTTRENELKYVASGNPCLGDLIWLTKSDDVASRILLLEEFSFQKDRKLVRNLVVPTGDPDCDFKACGMNKPTPPIQKQPPNRITRCKDPWKCVTIVTKTARRPHLVVRLAQSVRDSFGYDIPIAAFDDGPDDYSEDIRQNMARYPLLNYMVGDDEDFGIAEGRNRALALVTTKYFLLVDDDVMMLNTTDLQIMIDILDTTDTTLVGGQLEKRGNFAGLIKFGYFNDPTKTRKMGQFPGTCDTVNRTVPSYPVCVQCDINSNIFMARTGPIKRIGGWDPELKVLEHRDIFLRMKAAGLKVAVCHHVKLKHSPPKQGTPEQPEDYNKKRRRPQKRFRELLQNRYMIHGMFTMYGHGEEVTAEGEVMFYTKLNNNGFC